MHAIGRFTLAVPMLLGSLGAAPSPAPPAPNAMTGLGGHWQCVVAGGRPAERSYYVVTSKVGPNAGRREVFGREDSTLADGAPVTSFERISEDGRGNLAIEAAEGNGTAPDGASSSLRFAGRTFDGDADMVLTYAVNADRTMRRTAQRSTATVDDETCTREPDPPVVASCPLPNVPATTLRAVEPDTPFAAFAAKAKGVVEVRLVLDDRSRVLWADIVKSASPLLSDAAVQAARASRFQTAVVNCRPVPAEYVFSVDFE